LALLNAWMNRSIHPSIQQRRIFLGVTYPALLNDGMNRLVNRFSSGDSKMEFISRLSNATYPKFSSLEIFCDLL
jgi:hypothetical protein